MFSVATNTSSSPRLGTISVAGTVFTVTQSAAAADFIGFVDHAGCDSIFGWAADRNLLNTSINVQIFDGATLIATVPANRIRGDVGAFLGDDGLHGFLIPTPAALQDGAAHNVHINFGGSATELTGSPASISCSTLTPNYVGFVDVGNCGVLGGWAADRNRLNVPISVSIYDGSALLVTLRAGLPRSDVGAFLGDNGSHGWSFSVPASVQDGQPHTLHVKFETGATELSNSPAPLTFHKRKARLFSKDAGADRFPQTRAGVFR